MTIGTIVSGHTTLAPTQTLLIRPSGAIEWVIHNIYVPLGASLELYRTDGSTPVKIMNVSSSLLYYAFHCSNTEYLTVKNVGSTTITLGYDGTITME